MDPAPRTIDAATAEARLRALLKSGCGPGLPRREADRWILLEALAGTLGDAETLGEQAITERITQWLATTGARLETDAVTLRRALVDDGFVERDGRGQAYRRSRAHERRVVFPPAADGAVADTDLAGERCVACHAGAPRLDDTGALALLAELPAWSIEVVDGVPRLSRAFAFADFKSALAFADRIGAEAEAEGHHPELRVAWGKVTVGWWTHAIGGLHRNDFVMAARTSLLAGAASPA
ncbi:MAG: 4a-hydroxytetrahydrobiopterin dehydratase [Candidatus Eisenbacteria bacterium]